MMAQQPASEENKSNKERWEILLTLNQNLKDCQPPHPKASPIPAMIIFGELNTFGNKAGMLLMQAASIYNPIVRLREFYTSQDCLEASYYWQQVRIQIPLIGSENIFNFFCFVVLLFLFLC